MRRLLTCLAVSFLGAAAPVAGADGSDAGWESLHRLILPDTSDSQWMGVSWMPETNIWAARRRAAEEAKPLFLWYMAGEPLGTC